MSQPTIKMREKYDYLLWFFQMADFGPADGDVRVAMEEKYKAETGKNVPKSLRQEEE